MDLKRLCKKLLFPRLFVLIPLTVISGALLAVVFLKGLDTSPLAFAVYALSFYTLSVDTVFCVTVLPGYIRAAKTRVYENKFGNRYMTDAVFRTRISLFVSFGINLLYVAVNLISGYAYHTRWFYILSAYYAILAVMRLILLLYVARREIGSDLLGEWRRARLCAAILTLVNLTLSGVVLMMMYQSRGFTYHGMLIYVMAAYTFYTTTVAIVNIVKYRKYHSPVLSMTKCISLASALVSMLALETAMLSAFGADTSEGERRLMIALTGAGICIVVVAMSSYMIVRSTKEIQKAHTENANESKS